MNVIHNYKHLRVLSSLINAVDVRIMHYGLDLRMYGCICHLKVALTCLLNGGRKKLLRTSVVINLLFEMTVFPSMSVSLYYVYCCKPL